MRFCVIGPENSHHFLNQSDARIKSLRAERVYPACSLLPHAWKEIRNVQKRRFPFNAQCIHLFVLSIVLSRSRIFNFGTNNIFSPELIVNELRFER